MRLDIPLAEGRAAFDFAAQGHTVDYKEPAWGQLAQSLADDVGMTFEPHWLGDEGGGP